MTFDKSVNYIPQSQQTKERDIKPDTKKKKSLLKKQNTKISQNDDKFTTKISAQIFRILK